MLGCKVCGSDVVTFTSDSMWQCMACGHKDTQLKAVGADEAVRKIRADVLREIEQERIAKLKKDTDYIKARRLVPTKFNTGISYFNRLDKLIQSSQDGAVRWRI